MLAAKRAAREAPNLEFAGSNPISIKVLHIRSLFLFFVIRFIRLIFVIFLLIFVSSVFNLSKRFRKRFLIFQRIFFCNFDMVDLSTEICGKFHTRFRSAALFSQIYRKLINVRFVFFSRIFYEFFVIQLSLSSISTSN